MEANGGRGAARSEARMIFDFADRVGRRLIGWMVLSVAAGTVLVLSGDEFLRGIGVQAVAWGLIDGGIGWVGRRGAAKDRRAAVTDPAVPVRTATKLRRLLWLNTALDVLYVAGGLGLALVVAEGDRFTEGNGWGIVIQGLFLFLFDSHHAWRVPRPAAPADAGDAAA